VTLSCRDIRPQLSLLVDGLLPAEDQQDVRAHLGSCASCRGVLVDLEELRAAAHRLGPIAPPEHIWLEVAGQIRQGSVAKPRPAVASPYRSMWQWGAVAAVLVLAVGGVYLVQGPANVDTPAVATTAPTGSAGAVADELNLAAAHYEKAIAELEAMSKNSNSPIDPSVTTVVQQNLSAIDSAIAESRAALASNPDSAPARDSLYEALRRKIDVLRITVSLINEMRAGDHAGAERAVESLGKKS
jgi:hypothetical protein